MIIAQVEVEVQRQSMLHWFLSALGPTYAAALLGSGLILFIAALLAVVLSRRPAVSASLLAWVPLPILIGVIGGVQGSIATMQVIAMSGAEPKPSEMALGIAMCLVSVLVGVMAAFPGYLVLAIGLVVKTIRTGSAADRAAET